MAWNGKSGNGMTSEDLECYRINYSRGWKASGDGYTIPAFPCDGAVDAIHALCDEIERLWSERGG